MEKTMKADALLLEPDPELEKFGFCAQESLLQTGMETVQLILTNPTGITQRLEESAIVGTAEDVTIVPTDSVRETDSSSIQSVSTNSCHITDRKEKVKQLFKGVDNLSESQKKKFLVFLAEKHEVLAVDDGGPTWSRWRWTLGKLRPRSSVHTDYHLQ